MSCRPISRRINRELAERTDYESDDYQKLIERFTHLNDRFLMMGRHQLSGGD